MYTLQSFKKAVETPDVYPTISVFQEKIGTPSNKLRMKTSKEDVPPTWMLLSHIHVAPEQAHVHEYGLYLKWKMMFWGIKVQIWNWSKYT